ncbi:MAG TPA: hypothetical protein VNW04_01195, partial [Puia sp.]|nr:hypothetical protein [Puia sp.]
ITIKKLNMKLAGRTLGRIREFLSSMYRMDIANGLHLNWNGTQLSWPSIEEKLYVGKDGKRLKWDLDFEINGKKVMGWVGVLGKGAASRKAGGFSIFQNSRVIEGTYKPSSVFGEQDEGSNDLVNQRVTGELFLENFSVSHTKDKIVWEDDEQDVLDRVLGELCAEARHAALTLRFRKDAQRDELAKFKEAAVTTLTSELQSNELTDYLNTVQPYPEKIIDSSFSKISERAVSGNTPTIEATIGTDGEAIHVQVYFNESSEFEPYVLTETTVDKNKMLIIINVLHPYVQEMTDEDAFTSFVRQGIYDGVAEWKALRLRGSIQPNTIKMLKDGLLRIPYQIKSHKNV